MAYRFIGLSEPKLLDYCTDLYNEGSRCVHLLSFLADGKIELIEKRVGDSNKHLDDALKV